MANSEQRPILHHYPPSPFSEKVRLALGFKKLPWLSVIIPVIMPKPDLMPLTGGYRRTPVLQIGADIYCDTRLILRVLENLKPSPSLFPPQTAAVSETFAFWADTHLFQIAVAAIFSPEGIAEIAKSMTQQEIQAFISDRQAMIAASKTPPTRLEPALAVAQIKPLLAQFNAQLEKSPSLFGDNPCVADFSLYHSLWFLRNNPATATLLAPHKALGAWMKRLAGLGHGTHEEIDAKQALKIAQSASPPQSKQAVEGEGVKADSLVSVAEIALGIDPVEGRLVKAADDEIIIRRSDPAIGEVCVHFPQLGYRLSAA